MTSNARTLIIILLLNNIVCTICIYMVRKKSATTKTETHSSSYIVVVIFLPARFTILFSFVVDHCKIRRRCPVNVCFGDKHNDIILLHYIILCNFVSWMYIIIILYMYRAIHRASAHELHSSLHETRPDTSLLYFNLCVYSNILICASECFRVVIYSTF